MTLDAHLVVSKGSILRNIEAIRKMSLGNQEAYAFLSSVFPSLRGILFPHDEIIELGFSYDAIITQIIQEKNYNKIFASLYHEFKLDDTLHVRISRVSDRGSPRFEIYNYVGYVNREPLNIGDEVYVQIKRMKPTSNNKCTILETVLK